MRQDASTSSERFPLDTVLIRIAASEEHFHALSYSLLWDIFHLFKNYIVSSSKGGCRRESTLENENVKEDRSLFYKKPE